MTWAEAIEGATKSIQGEFPGMPKPSDLRAAKKVMDDLRIELVKRKWKGPVGDSDQAFYGNFERAKR